MLEFAAMGVLKDTWKRCVLGAAGMNWIIIVIIIIIIIIIKGIYIAQVRNGNKCAVLAEMALWLRLCLYNYLHN